MRRLLLCIGALAIIAAIALAAWKIAGRTMDTPVQATPRRPYPVADVPFFLQNDPQWAGDALGASRFKMAASGCLVSCIASSLSAQGMETDPGKLNRLFTENDVYNGEGDILWANIKNAFPDVQVTMPAQVDADALEKAVADSRFPIVKVKYNGSGYQHWVLLIGADENGYLCMDPLNSRMEPLLLSKHGGVIYRYRVVTVNR